MQRCPKPPLPPSPCRFAPATITMSPNTRKKKILLAGGKSGAQTCSGHRIPKRGDREGRKQSRSPPPAPTGTQRSIALGWVGTDGLQNLCPPHKLQPIVGNSQMPYLRRFQRSSRSPIFKSCRLLTDLGGENASGGGQQVRPSGAMGQPAVT